MQTKLSIPLALIAVLATSACKHKQAPPPAAPVAPPASAQPLPPPPAPKPACESLDEKCQALPETELAIAQTGVSFHPPPSFTYAKEATASISFAPDGYAVLGFAQAASEDPDSVLATMSELFTRFEITKPKAQSLKSRLKKPDSLVPSDGATLKLWEIERKGIGTAPELKGKTGSLLLVVASFGDRVIVGTGFVVKPEAEAQAQAIMASVQSLRGSK